MRGIVPKILPSVDITSAIPPRPDNCRWLIADENEKVTSIKKLLLNTSPSDVGIWVGPEGGFSREEVLILKESGGVPVTLGRRILRTETAGMAALANILCCWED
jgi:16S rRNA (uracil1498-N3)-methyltransferase